MARARLSSAALNSMSLAEFMDYLARVYRETQELKDQYTRQRDWQEYCRSILMSKLQEQRLKSASSDDGSFAVRRQEAVKLDMRDEAALMEWLENQPDLEADFYIGVKWEQLKPIIRTALKRDGEIVPGVEVRTDEVIYFTDKTKRKGELHNAEVQD